MVIRKAITAAKEINMTSNIKLKLVGLFITIALFALPIAEAAAHESWG